MEVTVAVVPSLAGDRQAALDALCAALGRVMQREVRGIVPATYAELASWLETDRVQYAWMSPALMVLTSERIRLEPLLMSVRNDHTEYCSALFVDGRKAAGSIISPQRSALLRAPAEPGLSINALGGKTVAWVDRTSASGYLVPRIHLAARGIDASTLFGKELFLGSHAAVVRAVFDGTADVGATYAEQPDPGQPITRAGFRDVAPDHPVRVLEWTQTIPNDVIVGHGLIPRADQRLFSNAVLTLAERDDGRALLRDAFHADRFTWMPRTALRPLWALVELARKNGLLAQL